MDINKFWEWNVAIVGILVMVVLVYLIIIINKRRKKGFLHDRRKNKSNEK